MARRLSHLTFAAAVSAIALLGATQGAQAGAAAFSTTQISNFIISNGSGPLTNGVNVTLSNPLNAESTSATLNATNTVNSNLAVAPNDNQSCLGNCAGFTPGNAFTLVTPTLQVSKTPFVQSAANLGPDELVNVPPLPAGAMANSAAQVQLIGANTGQSNSNVGVTAGFVLTLVGAGGSENITGTFNAFTQLLAQTDSTGASSFAQSSYQILVTDQNNNLLFSWNPNGLNTNASGSDLVSVNDMGVNLNNQRSANFDNLVLPYMASGTGLTFTANLPENVPLNFLITQRNFASAISIPEPMSLALFGAGLLGFGVVSRKRRRRA